MDIRVAVRRLLLPFTIALLALLGVASAPVRGDPGTEAASEGVIELLMHEATSFEEADCRTLALLQYAQVLRRSSRHVDARARLGSMLCNLGYARCAGTDWELTKTVPTGGDGPAAVASRYFNAVQRADTSTANAIVLRDIFDRDAGCRFATRLLETMDDGLVVAGASDRLPIDTSLRILAHGVIIPEFLVWVDGYIAVRPGDTAPRGWAFFLMAPGPAWQIVGVRVISSSPRALPLSAHELQLNNALLSAASDGRRDAVETALRLGADIECRSSDGWTPLIEAAVGDPTLISLLLSRGAYVNAASSLGYTALMRAAGQGACENVKVLLEAGADILARDAKGHTAEYMALKSGQRGCADTLAVHLLRRLEAEVAGTGMSAVALDDSEIALLMIGEMMIAKSSQPFQWVAVEFEDGSWVERAKAYDRRVLLVPEEYKDKARSTVHLLLEQP